MELLANGEETGRTLTLSADNNWTDSFTELDEYASGEKIEYTVQEKDVPDWYTVEVTGDAANGFVVTNSYIPETPDEPDESDNPDNPDMPDNPNTPDTPTTPSTPTAPGTSDTPNTGDSTHLALYIMLMILSLAGFFGTAIVRGRRMLRRTGRR